MSIPVMKADPMGRRDIEKAAQKILLDFCPESLSKLTRLDVEEMFEFYLKKRFGIKTAYEELSFGIHGYTDPNNLRSVVSTDLIDSSDPATVRFGRSTIGHEIGHAVLHAFQFKKRKLETKFFHDFSHNNTMLFRQQDLKPFENPEWQAWEFCKSLFLPKNLLEDAVREGMTKNEIANAVDLNPAFVDVRLKNLKMEI